MSNLPPLAGESLKIILIILLGWSFFAFSDTTVKFASQSVSTPIILIFNGLISTIILTIWIATKKGIKGFLSPNWKWLLARSVCIAATATGIVNAVAHIPLADLYGITFAAPFVSVVLASTLLKEQVGWHRWLAVIIGFIGVFILAGPQFDHVNIGLLYAIMASVAIATGTIVIRKIGKNEYLPLFILYPSIGILLAGGISAAFHINSDVMHWPDTGQLFTLTSISLLVMGGQFCTTYAIANAKATASIAPFVYSQIIWAVIFGYFLFGDKLQKPTIIGLALIIGAGLYMIYREQQLSKPTKPLRR